MSDRQSRSPRSGSLNPGVFVFVYERVNPVQDARVLYYGKIQATQTVLVRLKKTNTGATTTAIDYLHRDHIDNVDVITTSSAQSEHTTFFDAFGARRESDWSQDITQTSLDALQDDYDEKTSRGFTDHEMLDRTGIVQKTSLAN